MHFLVQVFVAPKKCPKAGRMPGYPIPPFAALIVDARIKNDLLNGRGYKRFAKPALPREFSKAASAAVVRVAAVQAVEG